MPTDILHAAKPSLAYAKLVATPTDLSWSQVYNAGNLFASLSLSLEQPEDGISLQIVGKEIFNNLEAEFFTLEEKNLNTIKAAIADSIKKVPEPVSISLCLAFFKDSVLYLFIVGEGRIIMKRDEKIGVLLEGHSGHHTNILTASGFVANRDTIVLETKQFSENIPDATLTSALELALPNDIAEALSPQLHAKDDGGQAAIIIVYHGIAKNPLVTEEDQTEITGSVPSESYPDDDEENYEEEEPPQRSHSMLPPLPKELPQIHVPKMKRIPHTKKLFLSIIIILVLLLATSIFLTKQQQENKQAQELFQMVYVPAQKNYEEGKELKSLNQSLSREDFVEAEQLITENIDKFKKGSKEEQQLTALLAKIREELGGKGNTTSEEKDMLKLKEATADAKSYLGIEKANSGISFAQDTNTVYVLTKNAISTIGKTSGQKKEQIANDDYWTNPVALSPYQGNMYVLDPKEGIVKFVSSAGKPSPYFSGSTPDLSNATSMAIDGSIWVLLKDGTILKYTRGQADSFKLSGLKQSMTNAIKIFTGLDVSNVYILDKGTGRVVIFDKKGTFQKEYAASVIKDAKDFEVLEKDKKVLILSDNKIWELPL